MNSSRSDRVDAGTSLSGGRAIVEPSDAGQSLVQRWMIAVALLPVAMIGVLSLWYPEDFDQALFHLGAERIGRGAVMYRDFWDIKQPGIYWLYRLGDLLGLGALGVRVLEVVVTLLAGALVWATTRHWGLTAIARVAAPTLVVGIPLLLTHRGGVAQVEGLFNAFVAAIVATCWPARPGCQDAARPTARWLLAGILVGILGIFKLLYVPLACVFLIGALLDGAGPRFRRALAGIVGILLPLAGVTAWFLALGLGKTLWLTTVQVPLEAATGLATGSSGPNPELLVQLLPLSGGLAVLGALGMRRRQTILRDGTFLVVVLAGTVLTIPQYPTPYRMLLIAGTLGLLAVCGLDTVVRWVAGSSSHAVSVLSGRFLAGALALGLLAVPLVRGPERLVVAAGQIPSWGLGDADRVARDDVLTEEHFIQDAAPVRDQITSGSSVYVFGNPWIYRALGAREAIEVTGWAATLMPERVWRERDRELARSRPAWLFIAEDIAPLLARHSPRLEVLLQAQYRLVAATGGGTWYRTDRPGPPAGIPGDIELG